MAETVGTLLALSLLGVVAPPRQCERFDDGWLFHRGEEPDAWQPTFADAEWRSVDLPHDWSIEDLPALPTQTDELIVAEGEWRFRKGDDPAWADPALDDAAWETVRLPAHWEDHSGYTEDNAYGWYRCRLPIAAGQRGMGITLALGKIDDVDETFVNGVRVGSLGQFPPSYETAWDQTRRYEVPAGLLRGDGTDVVAIRVFDGQGQGGFYQAATPRVRSGPFDSQAEGGGGVGFTVGGVGWYRKAFRVPEADRGKRVEITFDGVYMNSEVWLNGESLGGRPYGYTSFRLDLTPHLRYGAEANVLAVRVDASGRTSRWYPGAGVYRHVWLTTTDPVHLDDWGTAITTPEVSAESALVRVESAIKNEGDTDVGVSVEWTVLDPSGNAVASASASGGIPAGASGSPRCALRVERPALWSPDSPSLYRMVCRVSVGGRLLDDRTTTFGIRAITISAEEGLLLNGQPLELRGGCVHHDNGPLGSRTYDRAEERRVELLKAAGFNAIRTAHNPPSPAFLDACDRLGMLVMDEAFDCWRAGKNPQDYHRFFDEWWQRDLDAMVLRDRNHPCVFAWSIGNEVIEQGSPEGAEIGRTLAEYVRSLDPSRVTAIGAHPGTNPWENMDPLFGELGLSGYNYKWDRYAPDHQREPARVIAGTESFPTACFDTWRATTDNAWVIGDFVWTSFDYLGESGLGHTYYEGKPIGQSTWPWTAANCGDIDICGFRRPQSYYREAMWGTGPVLACFVETPLPAGETAELVYGWGWPNVQHSWTWPGEEGRALSVHAYASCERVQLRLNGRDLGTKDTSVAARHTAAWQIPYEAGELLAVGFDAAGQEVGRSVLRTAGPAATLRLTPDRTELEPDGQDLSFVTVEVLDAEGTLVANAADLVQFAVDGPGEIAAVANSDPRSIESFQQPQRRAWQGWCLVVLKAGRQPGTVRLTASAAGMADGQAAITVR